MKIALEVLISLMVILGGVFGAFWMMEERHAAKYEVLEMKRDLLVSELEIKTEALDNSIDDKNKTRKYYEDIKKEKGTLGEADETRVKYIESQLERDYQRQEKLQDRLYDLKK